MRNAERNAQWRHTLQSGVKQLVYRWMNLRHMPKNSRRYGSMAPKRLKPRCVNLPAADYEGRFWASNILQSLNELIQVLMRQRLCVKNHNRSDL